ncbi:MAG: hypothetical protein KME23_11900 [Goleter apudmare HA4340-LM2]|nr:hypothetical protein [Goleter apudmare HA4340-LM2]
MYSEIGDRYTSCHFCINKYIYIRDVDTLMNFGVPRREAETLAARTDV